MHACASGWPTKEASGGWPSLEGEGGRQLGPGSGLASLGRPCGGTSPLRLEGTSPHWSVFCTTEGG